METSLFSLLFICFYFRLILCAATGVATRRRKPARRARKVAQPRGAAAAMPVASRAAERGAGHALPPHRAIAPGSNAAAAYAARSVPPSWAHMRLTRTLLAVSLDAPAARRTPHPSTPPRERPHRLHSSAHAGQRAATRRGAWSGRPRTPHGVRLSARPNLCLLSARLTVSKSSGRSVRCCTIFCRAVAASTQPRMRHLPYPAALQRRKAAAEVSPVSIPFATHR